VTYAPADLLAVQRYLRDRTGQGLSSLGIIHSTPQGGGYHEGQDLLVAAGRAPGPQYPFSDYSYTDAPTRDLAPPHDMTRTDAELAGGDAASGFDFGGAFPRFLEFNAWMRQKMLAGDPRAADIREMIYTLDKRSVRRLDRTGKQPDSGDNSHLTHTHFSFFRDSLGRRDRDDNFLGLLREFFDGASGGQAQDMSPEQIRKAANADPYFWAWMNELDPIPNVVGDGLQVVVPGVPNKPLQRTMRTEAAVTITLPRLISEVGPGGALTQEQVDQAVLDTMLTPAVQQSIGQAIASHLRVT
jgi:hypothetical protein